MVLEFINKYFPNLGQSFKENDFPVDNFIHKWLLTLFIENFQEETTLLIWDCLFLEGNIVLIKSCLIIFTILKRLITKETLLEEGLFILFNTKTKTITRNSNLLLHGLSIREFDFTSEYLEQTRSLLGTSIIHNINEDNKEKYNKKYNNNKDTFNYEYNDNIKCNTHWPICIHENPDTLLVQVVDYFVLHKSVDKKNNKGRIDTPLIEDYFFGNNHNKKGNYFYNSNTSVSVSSRDSSNVSIGNVEQNDFNSINLLLERRKHYCEENIMKHNKNESEIILDNYTSNSNNNQTMLSCNKTNNEDNSDDNEYHHDNINKERLKIYTKMSTNKLFNEAKQKIQQEFKPKHALDDDIQDNS
jgi:hypothetical protein